ncbi:hypothetical protein KEM60_02541 [Austwickia sp. TVS 96-490-7B]|nr:hypothetical protein [Austwickia sp. TVS 96-490-7B]
MAPHVPAAGAAVAAQPHPQGRRAPPQRRVGQLPHRSVPYPSFAAAASAPAVLGDDAAGQHRLVRFHALPHGLQSKVVQAGEGGQIGVGEGSVAHVEVFQMRR